MDDIQLKESAYYLETYGNHALMVAFYQSHNFIENAFQYLIDKVNNLFFALYNAKT